MPISFNTYKTTTAQKLYNRKLIDKNAFNYIIESKTKYGLSNRVTDCFEDLSEKNSKMAVEISERGSVKQEELPLIKFLQTKMENLTVQFTKILSKKDTNPEVLEIKNKIKKEFGIKSLYLDNNKNFAKKLPKALKILKDNDMIIPDEIIVNSILALSMGIANPKKRIIILNSTLKPDYMMSTESPLHIIIHECVHTNQPDNQAINFIKMPDKFTETIDNLSMYASNNYILEIHAELMTKKLLEPKKFTAEEQEALSYIENLYDTLA